MVLLAGFIIALGIFAIVAGEADDSPGLQGIGVILILSVIYRIFRNRRKSE